uniref:Uncharacterized protein n=1 Tax=Globodera rostochiensis TaxID=31243 RepID=A0A914HSM2_GLORO
MHIQFSILLFSKNKQDALLLRFVLFVRGVRKHPPSCQPERERRSMTSKGHQPTSKNSVNQMTSGPCQQQSNLAAQSPERQGHPAMRHKRLNRPNKQNTVIAAVAIQRLEAAEVQAVWRRQVEVTRQRNAKESGEMESAKKEVSENERWREEAAVAEKRNAGRSNETKKQQEGRKLKKAIGKKGEERKKEAEEKKAEATTDLSGTLSNSPRKRPTSSQLNESWNDGDKNGQQHLSVPGKQTLSTGLRHGSRSCEFDGDNVHYKTILQMEKL